MIRHLLASLWGTLQLQFLFTQYLEDPPGHIGSVCRPSASVIPKLKFPFTRYRWDLCNT